MLAHQIARGGVVEQNLPGLSVAVGVGGELVWAEGFGWADLEARLPVAPDTRFRLGTGSVALTSAAVGLLLEQDRLNLDGKIQTYVRDFPEKPWPVTLRQLMGHVAGVRDDGGDEPGTQFRFTAQLLQSPQRLTAGEETGYGLGWGVGTVDLAGTPARWVGHDGTVLGGRVASLITFPDHACCYT